MLNTRENRPMNANRPRRAPRTVFVPLMIAALAMLLLACGGPPTEAMDAANKALLDSAWAEECAEDTYRAAEKMLAEAQEAADAGEYEEAKRKADAAVRLAEQARNDAELNREDCERRKEQKQELADNLGDKDDKTVVTTSEEGFELHTIYFDFNEAVLTKEAQKRLQDNASWLTENQTVNVRIEGHTDDRGSTEYNLALSQRRAQSVKRFMQTLGVDASRMAVVPYGEERPAAYGDSEADHAKNRRAEFVTLGKE